jgi:hypothetical protein
VLLTPGTGAALTLNLEGPKAMPNNSTPRRRAAPTKTKKTRQRRLTVTALCVYGCDIKKGDVVLVQDGEIFNDGDLVAFDFYGEVCVAYLFHSTGKNFKYFAKGCLKLNNRRMLRDEQCSPLGLVIEHPEPRAAEEHHDSTINYLSKHLANLHDRDRNAWNLVTDIIAELADASDLSIWSQAIVGAVLTEAFKRAETGKNPTGAALSKPTQAIASLRDLREVVNAIVFSKPIPQKLWEAYDFGDAPPNHAKILELRERLNKLDEDDITDSSARLKLESEIYQLEHEKPVADDSILDADLIGEGGASE